MYRTFLRIQVQSIILNSIGDPPDRLPSNDEDEKNNIILATLKYPRSGAPNVISKIEADIENGVALTFNLKDFWKSGLFKEEVHGETVLTIQVTDRDKISKIEKILSKVLGNIFQAGLGLLTKGIASPILGAVANMPVKAVAGSIPIEKDEKVFIIGKAELALSVESIPQTIELPLIVPDTIKKEYLAFDDKHKPIRKTYMLKKGTENGKILLLLSTLPA